MPIEAPLLDPPHPVRAEASSRSGQAAAGGGVGVAEWKQAVAPYVRPDRARAIWQLVNTLGPYAATWALMHAALGVAWWLAIPLVLLASGLAVRVFIIFHDCGHGSFFKSRRANTFWGCVTGVLVFTPFQHWRWEHSVHHATAGDLERRGMGDIWTLTVDEYLAAPWRTRVAYRIARNPIAMFVLAPVLMFVFRERVARRTAGWRERRSVWGTNLALVGLVAAMASVFGLWPYVILQTAVIACTGTAGVWLFYVQHQFEDAYWQRDDWDYTQAALRGSSYYRLPRVLQWFSGNIGFHHIHHLSPRIANYHLEACHRANPMFNAVPPLRLLPSLKTGSLRLWDERRGRLIRWRDLPR